MVWLAPERTGKTTVGKDSDKAVKKTGREKEEELRRQLDVGSKRLKEACTGFDAMVLTNQVVVSETQF